MATVEKKPHNVAKFYRGELFDLTITSANNKFGKEKIVHSLDNGINFKIDYFIKELGKMTTGKQDDKSIKRKIRKEFLDNCKLSKFPFFIELFDLLINYLNGGQTLTMKNEYNNQSLIVVLMGGNIINIYFNIIYYSIETENITLICNIFDTIPGLSHFICGILHQFNQWLQQDENKNFVNFMKTNKKDYFNNYSDLDFALLPNNLDIMEVDGGGSREKRKRTSTKRYAPVNEPKPKRAKSATKTKAKSATKTKAKSAKAKSAKAKLEKAKSAKAKSAKAKSAEAKIPNQNIEELESANGFLLYRIKSNFSILDENVDSASAQRIKFFKDIKKENDTINDSYTSKQIDCNTSDMGKFGILFRSELIAHLAQKDWATKEGVSDKCKSFIENLLAKKERIRLCTNKNTEIICNNHNIDEADDLNKLKNLITYIRKITRTINIHLTEKGIISEVHNIFDNLHTIMNPKNNLVNICNSIVKEFYELKATEDVINNINGFYKNANAVSNDFSISTFNIKKYPFIEHNINHLQTLLTSNVKSGIILTVNLISGNKNDKVIYSEYENENEYFDDLEKEFMYDQKKEAFREAIRKTDALLIQAKGKRKNIKKIDALTRKCKNKKYRKKHTKKCRNFFKS
jgi:hypothetical protein